MTYSARTDYQSDTSACGYEKRRMYSGIVGQRRVAIERSVIAQLIDDMSPNSTVLDCPCGNGRWLDVLAKHAVKLDAIDISEGMVRAAQKRSSGFSIPVDVRLGDAEHLDLVDDAVDYTFSYALMKHLPVSVQARVLTEFARVSAKGVICSFAVFRPVSHVLWRLRHPPESYPVMRDEIASMASTAGLQLKRLVKISQPLIGLEHFAVLAPKTPEARA